MKQMKWVNWLFNTTQYYLEQIYPSLISCSLCGNFVKGAQAKQGLCPACFAKWQQQYQMGDPCPHCGFFRRYNPCAGSCSHGLAALDFIIAAAPYEGNYRQLVQSLKYDGCQQLIQPMSFMMAQTWLAGKQSQLWQQGTEPLLVPIPMHPAKEALRGFNQSQLLAQQIGHQLGLKVECLLVKILPGKIQAGLDGKQRQLNAQSVFALAGCRKLNGKLIILVDDVVTTGATLEACGEILRSQGCPKIAALTFGAGMWQSVKPQENRGGKN